MKLHNIAGLCAGVSIFCMSPVAAFASTQSTQPQSQPTGPTQSTQSVSQKAIALNQKTISNPYGTVHDGTTYMPIWYLMNALQKLGVQASWDGKNLQLTGVPGLTPDLKQVNPGSGSMAIYLNGQLVQKVDGSTAVDPAANQQTTYMPLWYLMEALNRMQVNSDWDGVTWNLNSPGSTSTTSSANGTTGSYSVSTGSLNTRNRTVSSMSSPDSVDTSITPGTSGTSSTANKPSTSDSAATSGAAATPTPSTGSSSSSSSTSSSGTSSSSSSVSGQDIVNYAKQFIGTPYVYGGTTASGFDCSGLVKTVFAHYSISLPRTAAEQAQVGQVISKSNLQPGDLVFFNTTGAEFSHVGIYVGNGQFISATTSKGVRICNVSDPYYWGAKYTRATNPQG